MDDTLFFFMALTLLGIWIFVSGRRRKKAAEELKSKVVKGAFVMLTSGIYGKISSVNDDRIELETAPGQKLTVAVGAVRSIEKSITAPAVRKTRKVAPPATKAKAPVSKTRTKSAKSGSSK
jgi:preprotein translocase subunit YajC